MKLAELRGELSRRGLPTLGNKKTLQKRLDEANSKKGTLSPSHSQQITYPIEEVRTRAGKMFQEGLFSDVTVNVTSSRPGECSESLDLHRNVLSHFSDFFRGMFTRCFRESGEETVTIEVAEGSSVTATVLVLKYLYTSIIEINSDNVFEVLAAADKLQLTGLRDSCEAYLAQNLCEDSVCSTWKASHLLGLSQLALKCRDLVLSEGKAVLKGGGFGEIPKDLALAVVADEKLNASEEDVFEAVVLWGEANKGAGSVRDAVAGFVPHLRFVEMGHAFIHNRVRQSGLVSESTLFDAVVKITDELTQRFQPGCKRAFAAEIESEAAAGPSKKRRRG
jgi:hypothetical protein